MTLTVAPGHVGDLAQVADALAVSPQVALVTAAGKRVKLPDELLEVLSTVAHALSDGQEILVATKDSYLTAQEAADYLGVSRPTMIRILDLGQVPYERPNSHRRIKLADLAKFKAERETRRKALDGLLAMSDEMSQYDTDSFVRTR